MNHITV